MSKAILVTQELKDKNESFFSNNTVDTIVIKIIPDVFNGSENINAGGYKGRTDLQTIDGWKNLVQPVIGENQKRGVLVLYAVNDVYTYTVVDLTDEEIQAQKVSESESRKQEIIQADIVLTAETEAQNADDTDSLNNQDLFPMWSGDSVEYALDHKVQSFDTNNELILYKVVQAHTSQPNWNPESVPALFTRVAFPDEILVFVQPTGAQDAYNIGDKVWFPDVDTEVYESVIDANVWSPTAYPAGWVLV